MCACLISPSAHPARCVRNVCVCGSIGYLYTLGDYAAFELATVGPGILMCASINCDRLKSGSRRRGKCRDILIPSRQINRVPIVDEHSTDIGQEPICIRRRRALGGVGNVTKGRSILLGWDGGSEPTLSHLLHHPPSHRIGQQQAETEPGEPTPTRRRV